MSYPQASNIPDEAAGVTGSSGGAPYSAAGHGPDATTVAEAMSYRQSEIAAHDKPIESDIYGNGFISGIAGGWVGMARPGPGIVSFAKSIATSVVTAPAKAEVAHFLGEALTGIKENVSDIISSHHAGGDHGPADPSLSSAPDSSAHPGMSSGDLTCSDPATSHDPNVSIETGASHDYAASFDDYYVTPGY